MVLEDTQATSQRIIGGKNYKWGKIQMGKNYIWGKNTVVHTIVNIYYEQLQTFLLIQLLANKRK